MGMLKEFKEFAMRGNVIDLAVGVIMGAAFGPIVKSLVDDIIMPPIGYLINNIDFSKLAWHIRVSDSASVDIGYGKFINAVITFVITAFAVFLLVKAVNRIAKKKEEAPKLTKGEELLVEIRDLLRAKV